MADLRPEQITARNTCALAWLQTVVVSVFLLILCFPKGRNAFGFLMAAFWTAQAIFWWKRAYTAKGVAQSNEAVDRKPSG